VKAGEPLRRAATPTGATPAVATLTPVAVEEAVR